MQDICILRCKHVLCLKCIITWFAESTTCPFCRLNIDDITLKTIIINTNESNNQILCDKLGKVFFCLSTLCGSSFFCFFLYKILNF